ncbi:MAG: filamentous hemagglutinin N-terminal domain-containing protein [Cyanobacteria bacterium P01_D01_bin.50]
MFLYFFRANLLSVFKGICGVLSLWLIAATNDCVKAEIIPDQTLGEKNSVVDGNNLKTVTGGLRLGTNLFHSFEKFNINEGQSALFRSGNGIENIINRVTGNSRSEILGNLIVVGNNANFFLINPNGIMFGSNAELNIGGSFIGTTADAIGFGDRGFFSALVPDTPELLTVKPSALLFNQIANQPITLQSTATGLAVSPNQSLLLVGGGVNLEGARLSAPGGRIELGGLAGIGTVELNVDTSNVSLNFPDDVARADVSLTNRAIVRTSNNNSNSQQDSGDIQVHSRRLTLQEGSQISTTTFSQGLAGNLTVNASESVELSGTSTGLFAQTQADGNAGDLRIDTKRLILEEGSQISTTTFSQGLAGNLTVNASESVKLSGGFSGLFAGSQEGGSGSSGNLTIDTGKLLVENGAQVTTSSLNNDEEGGNLTVKASESVELIGSFLTNQGESRSSGLFVGTTGAGDAGELTIETGKLLIQDGAIVSARTLGEGDGGSVIIDASESVSIIGTSLNSSDPSTITTETRSGNGGNIEITVKDLLLLRDRSQISTTAGTSNADGNGGNITIQSPNGFLVALPQENSDITANAFEGSGGVININTFGVFGIEEREELTEQSDITAFSEQNPQLDGVVNIDTQEKDPTEESTELPSVPLETEFYDVCQASTGENASEFHFVGTGGIPPSPLDLLQEESVDVGWVSLPEGGEERDGEMGRWGDGEMGGRVSIQNPKSVLESFGGRKSTPQTFRKIQNPIVEATGMIVDENGDIFFVAQASPQSTPSFNNKSCVKR